MEMIGVLEITTMHGITTMITTMIGIIMMIFTIHIILINLDIYEELVKAQESKHTILTPKILIKMTRLQ